MIMYYLFPKKLEERNLNIFIIKMMFDEIVVLTLI
jgi:hypothetical protein